MTGIVLVTGANGFIGKALCEELIQRQYQVRGTVRTQYGDSSPCPCVAVGDIGNDVDWTPVLDGVDVVVHLAARVHVMHDDATDPLNEFRRINTRATERLAYAAAAHGVKRLVYLSSIKVNGEETQPGHPFFADDEPHPVDPYGISKYEAELALQKCAQATGLEIVIIRPVLVYGPGVKGNFQTMMRWLNKGMLLPLGALNNKRSLMALDNLVDLISICLHHPNAANKTLLVSDGNDVSTTELLILLADALGKPVHLLSVSPVMLKMILYLFGKSDTAQRLCGSLQVDISKTNELLEWTPPLSMDDMLQETASAFLASNAILMPP